MVLAEETNIGELALFVSEVEDVVALFIEDVLPGPDPIDDPKVASIREVVRGLPDD